MIYALWHGGASYAVGDISGDVETFPTLAAAMAEFRARVNGRGAFTYADGRTCETGTPAVSDDTADNGGPSMVLWRSDPREDRDPYPDSVIRYGPRGGLRVSPA